MKLLFIIAIFVLTGCSEKINMDRIAGQYEIDKFIIRDTLSNVKTYPLMFINSNNNFELKSYDDNKDVKKGTWNVIGYEKEKTILEFTINKGRVKGILNGTIISFEYPEDLYSGKYNRLLYVKLKSKY